MIPNGDCAGGGGGFLVCFVGLVFGVDLDVGIDLVEVGFDLLMVVDLADAVDLVVGCDLIMVADLVVGVAIVIGSDLVVGVTILAVTPILLPVMDLPIDRDIDLLVDRAIDLLVGRTRPSPLSTPLVATILEYGVVVGTATPPAPIQHQNVAIKRGRNRMSRCDFLSIASILRFCGFDGCHVVKKSIFTRCTWH